MREGQVGVQIGNSLEMFDCPDSHYHQVPSDKIAATAETETATAPADQKDHSEGILEKPTSAESESFSVRTLPLPPPDVVANVHIINSFQN